MERNAIFNAEERVAAMKQALEGDPDGLFSALARISESHYLVHAYGDDIEASFSVMEPFRIYRGKGKSLEEAISHLFHTYIGEHDVRDSEV